MGKCSGCNQNKTEDEFIIRNKTTGRRGKRCKKCRAKVHLKWYHLTKEKRKPLRDKWRLVSKKKIMQVIVDYLQQHPCVDCGEKDIIVLEFDHIRDKKHNISSMLKGGMPIKKILEEIDKCEVRCANCHRRKTAERGKWYMKQGFLTQ